MPQDNRAGYKSLVSMAQELPREGKSACRAMRDLLSSINRCRVWTPVNHRCQLKVSCQVNRYMVRLRRSSVKRYMLLGSTSAGGIGVRHCT
jgi:hypothetical protein